MYLSEGTVKQYVNRIYAKLGIEGSGRQSKRQTLRSGCGRAKRQRHIEPSGKF